jgi:hypothetical protein
MQICQYIEKPIDLGELADHIITELHASGHGHVRGFTLSTFIQTIAMDRMTCTLLIRVGQRVGRAFFREGDLLDATTDTLSGRAAALEIFSWAEPEIEILGGCRVKERSIDQSLNELLMESCRVRDEREAVSRRSNGSAPQGDVPRQDDQADAIREKLMLPLEEESQMNVQKLNEAIETLKSDLGPALIATDIITNADGQSIAGYNSQPKAAALFCQMTRYMVGALKDAGFPGLGKYYMVHLQNNFVVTVIPMGDFQWGVLVDLGKTTQGLLLNVVLPKALAVYEQAVK